MRQSNQLIYKPFWGIRNQILDGYALLWRRRGLISIGTGNPHSHIEMAGWWGDHLMTLGLREFEGGRAKTLASQVDRYPGRIDVYHVVATPDQREAALEAMKGKCGHEYGYWPLLSAACLHLPVLRLFSTPDLCDHEDDRRRPEFCSQGFSSAYAQHADVDLVHEVADRETSPGQVAQSARTRYLFTLIP